MLNRKQISNLRRVVISLLIYVPITLGLLELFSYYLDRIHASPSFIEIALALSFFGMLAVIIRAWFLDIPGKKFSKLEFALLGSNLVLCLIVFQFFFNNSEKDWNKGILLSRKSETIRIGMLGITKVSGQNLPDDILDAIQKSVLVGLSHIDDFQVIDAGYVNLRPGKGLEQLGDPNFKNQLNIDYVISLTLLPRSNEESFRMLVNLLNIDDLKIEWSGQYDTEYASFFSTVNRITMELAKKYGRKSKYEPVLLNGSAVKPFLKGIHNYRKYTLESRYQASRYFQEAFLKDTSNILPLIYRAVNDLNLIFYGYVPQPDRIQGIKSIVEEGMKLGIPEAYTAQALHDLFFDYNWKSAEKNLIRSMELAPYDYVNYFELGIIQGLQGKWDKALNTFHQYRNNDPLNEMYRLGLSVSFFQQGLVDSAFYFYSQYHQVKTAEEPEAIRFPLILDYYLGNKTAGEIDCDLKNGDLVCAWLAGKNQTPIELIEERIKNIQTVPGFHTIPEEMVKASYYSGAGDFNTSLEYLKVALQNKSPYLVFLKMGMFPWLEGDEEGKALLKEMGLEA
jgi:tetratricopeptide (TPR) repeat protein